MSVPLPDRRAPLLHQLTRAPLDVLVVGGGIVGSGIARDAAMRGLRVGLVEQHDFAFGTSSRSSRLLHGGLRYLEQGHLGLVREANREKKILHRIAPHLAEPLGFIFPTYRATGRPLWQLRIGVRVYDLLCGEGNFAPSRGLTRAQTLSRLPALRPDGLRGSVRYFDALTNDARLVIDTLSSAARQGATLLNYVRLQDARRERVDTWQCDLVDQLTGVAFSVNARTIVNATGPWAEQLPHSAVRLRLSKGIHLVVDRERLPVSDAVVLTAGKRILFILPWGERLIIGTTDTDYTGAPEGVTVEAEDIAYLLEAVHAEFPEVSLGTQDIVSCWAGLRPLLADGNGSPSDVSRAHEIRCPEPGWWDVAGGKLTTYRLMAEQTVDGVVRHLQRTVAPCRTKEETLLAPDGPAAEFSGIRPPPCTRDAVEHYVTREWAVSLEDVLIRRSGWHDYLHREEREAVADQVAAWMAELNQWTPAERAAARQTYRVARPAPSLLGHLAR